MKNTWKNNFSSGDSTRLLKNVKIDNYRNSGWWVTDSKPVSSFPLLLSLISKVSASVIIPYLSKYLDTTFLAFLTLSTGKRPLIRIAPLSDKDCLIYVNVSSNLCIVFNLKFLRSNIGS